MVGLLVSLSLPAQKALADCWGGDAIASYEFLERATVADVENCLRRGFDANRLASDGFAPLNYIAEIGETNPHAVEIVLVLLRAGGDPHFVPSRLDRHVTAIYRAETDWGRNSDVARAMRGEMMQEEKMQDEETLSSTAEQTTRNELWGAFVAVPLDYETGASSAYGLSWNYPSLERAKEAAIGACAERADYNACSMIGVERFSSSAPYEDDWNFRMPCFAVVEYLRSGEGPFYAGAAGTTQSDAERQAERMVASWGFIDMLQVVTSACNAE